MPRHYDQNFLHFSNFELFSGRRQEMEDQAGSKGTDGQWSKIKNSIQKMSYSYLTISEWNSWFGITVHQWLCFQLDPRSLASFLVKVRNWKNEGNAGRSALAWSVRGIHKKWTGYSFWDRLRHFLQKFTRIVLSVHEVNKLGKFW